MHRNNYVLILTFRCCLTVGLIIIRMYCWAMIHVSERAYTYGMRIAFLFSVIGNAIHDYANKYNCMVTLTIRNNISGSNSFYWRFYLHRIKFCFGPSIGQSICF